MVGSDAAADNDDDDENYTVPINNQRVFGAGIKRKRIAFVRASGSEPVVLPTITSTNTPTLAEQFLQRYREKEEKHAQRRESASALENENENENGDATPCTPAPRVCGVCRQSIRTDVGTVPHEATTIHQIALQHSHGPSAISRTSKAMPYMRAQGWNPDDRQGLGAAGDGILYPIEVQEKKNRFGLGVEYTAKEATEESNVSAPTNLTARQIRKLDDMDRKKADELRNIFYRDEKVEKLLGALQTGAPILKSNKRPKKAVNGFESFTTRGRR